MAEKRRNRSVQNLKTQTSDLSVRSDFLWVELSVVPGADVAEATNPAPDLPDLVDISIKWTTNTSTARDTSNSKGGDRRPSCSYHK